MSEFYILSLKWTRRKDNLLTWWGPSDSGYVFKLECAGRYSAEQVEANRAYYDSGEHTLAVPCETAEVLSVLVGEAMSKSISPDRAKTDRVVEYHHYTALKAAHGFRRKRAQTRKRWQTTLDSMVS